MARAWHLKSRPSGMPSHDNFELRDVDLPPLGEGMVRVKNRWLSVDPYMRGRMNDGPSYAAPYELDRPMYGGAVGRVEKSTVPAIAEGTIVRHGLGWREWAVVPARQAEPVDPAADGVPTSAYLGVLGMPGLTAWAGLFRLASFSAGDAVFVSGAAGAVGSLVGQFARLRGASRVVGSAGTAEKVAWLRSIGFDDAFDYHDGAVADLLAGVAPEGIDVFFDNVGGEHLEAAIGAFRTYGRAALCGSISTYNAVSPPPGPRNLGLVVGKRLSLRGFIVGDHADLRPEFVQAVSGWLRNGSLVARETVVAGLDSAVDAFRALLSGGNTGKMVVRLTPDPG
jgi:NADPH-dependent curcumin reductase CurA